MHRWSASRRRRRRGFVRGAGTPAHARRRWGSGRRNYRGTSAQRCGEAGERCRHGRQVSLAGLVSSALSSARCAYFQAVAALGGDGLGIATHRQWRRLENTNADVCAGLSRRSLRFCLCSCVSWARGCAAVAAPVAARCSPTRVCELSARGCVSTRCIILTEPSFALAVCCPSLRGCTFLAGGPVRYLGGGLGATLRCAAHRHRLDLQERGACGGGHCALGHCARGGGAGEQGVGVRGQGLRRDAGGAARLAAAATHNLSGPISAPLAGHCARETRLGAARHRAGRGVARAGGSQGGGALPLHRGEQL